MSEPMTDVASERAVLAGLCRHGQEAWLDCADWLGDNTFTGEQSRAVFQAVRAALSSEQAPAVLDYPTIIASARPLGLAEYLEQPDQSRYLRAVLNLATTVRTETVPRLAGRLRRLEIARIGHERLAGAMQELETVTGEESAQRILDMVESPVFDFSSMVHGESQRRGYHRLGENAEAYYQFLMDNPRERIGIDLGFPKLNDFLGGGSRSGSVDVIVARAKTGKSWLVDKIGIHVAAQGIPTLSVDLEMTAEEHLHRVGGILAGLNVRDIEKGAHGRSPENRLKLCEAGRRLRDMPYDYLCGFGMPFEQVLIEIRRWILREVGLDPNTGKAKPCLILFDWLKIADAGTLAKNVQEYQQLGFQTTGLKNLMNRYGAACVCMAQANRQGIKGDDDEAVTAASDRITWFATSLSIYRWLRPEEMLAYSGNGRKFTHCFIGKLTRHGDRMDSDDAILVETRYETAYMAEGPTRKELEAAGSAAGLNKPVGFAVEDEDDAAGL